LARKDWRTVAERVEEPLTVGTWYRSPLWEHDHCLGRDPVWIADGSAWCGRALGTAMDWDNADLGGLWFTNRTSAKCTQCARQEREHNEMA